MSIFKKIFNNVNVDKAANSDIDKKIKENDQNDQRSISLLLLGSGGSGKSTVLKQMEKIYCGEIDEKVMEHADSFIRQNILDDIYDICRQNLILSKKDEKLKISSGDLQEICENITTMQFFDSNFISAELADNISKLWKDPAIQETFNIRKKAHIMDNTPYFIGRIHKIASKDYKPNFEDFLRVRHRTTGIIHSTFEAPFDNAKWTVRVTDVGGQRTERKKWIHCFDDVDAVIYVMSLSGYDQVLFEDHETRCWDETLQLFENTAGLKPFVGTDFVVFLNKNDIFEEKIKKIPFTVYYEDFDDDSKYNGNDVKEFIKNEFRARFYNGKDPKQISRSLHFHVTCSIDTNQIQTVMSYIQLDTVRKMMKKSALL